MNVKLGDLAIVILPSQPAGIIGKVIRFVGEVGDTSKSYPNCWCVQFPRAYRTNNGQMTNEPYVPDAWLRPVSGLPMQDETAEETKIFAHISVRK